MQRQECPPTCDTRLTGGSRVAREAASACKRWRIESALPISCGDRHFQGMTLDAASCNGRRVHPPVTPVWPVAPVSPVKPLAPASDGALRAQYPLL